MTSPPPPTSSGSREERVSAQLPSFEERTAAQDWTTLSHDARLIRWTLDGPLTEAISVMQNTIIDPDDAVFESYHRAPGWHPFSQSPLTTPKISSVTIRVDPLDEWEHYWLENHRGHADPDCNYDPADVRFGPLPDPDEYENEREVHLLVCCGMERPRKKGTNILVKATGDFLTIHDFLSVVHPYLMARRDDILAALGEQRFQDHPAPAHTTLMVSWVRPKDLTVRDEAEWLQLHAKPKKIKSTVSQAASEAFRQRLAARS